MRLGILTSHPIQYQAPWFRELAKQADLEVFFAHRQSAAEQGKAGFGVPFDWDVDLLTGYQHCFLKNVSANPGVNHYDGCDTPEIEEILQEQMRDGSLEIQSRGGLRSPDALRRRFDAFIVSGWYLKSYRQAVRACRKAGVPVLVRGDSQLRTPRSYLRRLVMEFRQRWLLRQFDGFLSVGKRHADYLRHYGVPPEKIFFVPHFVDNDWFADRAAEVRSHKAESRRKWGIPDDAFVAMFCGKFIPKKRPLDLVKAASVLLASNSELASTISKIHLLFVGAGELGHQLRSACHVVFDADAPRASDGSGVQGGNSPNPDSRCESPNRSAAFMPLHQPCALGRRSGINAAFPTASFLGFKNQSELPACYVAADVLVLPSDGEETWGLVVNEAMACGLPAIVSDAVGCAPDLIDEGQTGGTFPVGEIATLAKKLSAMAALKQAAHNFAPLLATKTKDYSIGPAVTGTLRAVKTLCGKAYA